MFAVLRTVGQELAAGMLLVAGMSKSDRIFACVLRPVIGTVGTMYYFNMVRSQGRATGARSRRGSSAPCEKACSVHRARADGTAATNIGRRVRHKATHTHTLLWPPGDLTAGDRTPPQTPALHSHKGMLGSSSL